MTEIFVSYARKDKEQVQEIMRYISSSGYEYWMDSQKIQGGELWTQEITEAIAACRVFLFFMSADSILSDNCRREVQLAFEKNRKIVILRLDRSETPLHLQYALAGIQWIDHGDSDWKSRLSLALTRTPVLPQPKSIVPTPEAPRSSHDHDIEQVRRFEGAMPATTNLNLPTEVRVMISLSTSRGLRAHLPQTAHLPGEMTKRDVKRSDVPLNFPRDPASNEPLDLDLWIVITAQGFDIEQPAKKIRVPAKTDSGVFSFALTPRVASQHAIITLDLRERKTGPTLGTLTLTTEVKASQGETIQQFWSLASLLMTSAVIVPAAETRPSIEAYRPAAKTVQISPNQGSTPVAEPAMRTAPRPARGTFGSIALLALCACVGISTVFTFQAAQSLFRPVAIATEPVPTSTQMPISGPPTAKATETVPTMNGQVTFGPWKGQVGRLQLTVDKVEVVSQIGDKKILRFYLSVNNQSGYTLRLPLFGNFQAIDSNGQTYRADYQISQWPESLPAGLVVTGSIDLMDPVPKEISNMKINFSTIFGASEFVGKSVTVSDIEVP